MLEKTVVDNPVVDRLIEEREAIDYKEGNGFSMFIIIDIKKVHQV